jgi:hypothetical protein
MNNSNKYNFKTLGLAGLAGLVMVACKPKATENGPMSQVDTMIVKQPIDTLGGKTVTQKVEENIQQEITQLKIAEQRATEGHAGEIYWSKYDKTPNLIKQNSGTVKSGSLKSGEYVWVPPEPHNNYQVFDSALRHVITIHQLYDEYGRPLNSPFSQTRIDSLYYSSDNLIRSYQEQHNTLYSDTIITLNGAALLKQECLNRPQSDAFSADSVYKFDGNSLRCYREPKQGVTQRNECYDKQKNNTDSTFTYVWDGYNCKEKSNIKKNIKTYILDENILYPNDSVVNLIQYSKYDITIDSIYLYIIPIYTEKSMPDIQYEEKKYIEILDGMKYYSINLTEIYNANPTPDPRIRMFGYINPPSPLYGTGSSGPHTVLKQVMEQFGGEYREGYVPTDAEVEAHRAKANAPE